MPFLNLFFIPYFYNPLSLLVCAPLPFSHSLYLYLSGHLTLFLSHPFSCYHSLSYSSQGNAAKLVHTPLTDKCYLTLTQAMKMGLGGNPYGPAGTGKTESVKALGGLFGRQVLVFNCDEVHYKNALGEYVKGFT